MIFPNFYPMYFLFPNLERGGALSFKDPRRYKMAVAFFLAWDYGIPRIMSSFAFDNHDTGPPMDANENLSSPQFNPDGSCMGSWICQHRWRQIYNMVEWRNVVARGTLLNWWDNDNNQIAFSKGNRGFIAINGESTDMAVWLNTGLPPGSYCDVISGARIASSCSGKIITVYADSRAYFTIAATDYDGVVAIHIDSRL